MRGTSPELKRKRGGVVCVYVRPSWLDLGPSACCGVSSTSEQSCHWLSPSAGQQPFRIPRTKHNGAQRAATTLGVCWSWNGIIIICGRAWCSAFGTVRGAECNSQCASRTLGCGSLLMLNSKSSQQTSYQSNVSDSGQVGKVLSKGRNCGCMCELKAVDVITFCTHFHSLSEDASTHYFHTTYDTCGDAAMDIPTKAFTN